MVATSHGCLLSSWNMDSVGVELNLKYYLILIKNGSYIEYLSCKTYKKILKRVSFFIFIDLELIFNLWNTSLNVILIIRCKSEWIYLTWLGVILKLTCFCFKFIWILLKKVNINGQYSCKHQRKTIFLVLSLVTGKFLSMFGITWVCESTNRLGADCGSDHDLFIAKFRLELKKVGKTTRPLRYD